MFSSQFECSQALNEEPTAFVFIGLDSCFSPTRERAPSLIHLDARGLNHQPTLEGISSRHAVCNRSIGASLDDNSKIARPLKSRRFCWLRVHRDHIRVICSGQLWGNTPHLTFISCSTRRSEVSSNNMEHSQILLFDDGCRQQIDEASQSAANRRLR